MGKDVKKRFTVSLDIETKDVEKQVKATVGNLKTILADLGKASDKMGYFKELVDYIGQIDTALTALRAKNKDAFNHMFDGLDADLKKAMEGIFDTSSKTMSALDALRGKLNDASKNGAGVKELRQIASEINDLFTSLGRAEPIDIDAQFSGRGKTEDRINILTDALDNFATVWDGVNNKVKSGFGFGGAGGIVEFSEEVQKEIDALENKIKSIQDLMTELQNVFKMTKAFSDGKDVPLGFEATEESAKNLLEQFKLLSATRQKFLEDGDTSSPAYYENLIQYTKAATQLVALNDELAKSSKGSPKFLANALSGEFVDVYDFIESFDKKFVSGIQTSLSKIVSDAQTGIDKIKADALKNMSPSAAQGTGRPDSGNDPDGKVKKNKELSNSYEELAKKIKEYAIAQEYINNGLEIDDDGVDLEEKIRKLDEFFLSLDKVGDKANEIRDILGDLSFGDIGPNKALEKLSALLQIKKESDVTDGSPVGPGASTTTGSKSGGTITNVDFTSLENTIKAEISSLANKLDSVFKVEVVKNDTEDIKNAIDGIKSTIEKISAEIDSYNTLKKTDAHQAEVNAMKNNLTQLFKFVSEFNNKQLNGQYQDQEISAAILSDGSITTGYGEDGTVPWDRMASALVSNLTKSLMVDIHSHPWAQNGYLDRYANDSFSGSKGDLGAFRFSKELGAQMAAMITGNVMRTLDISKLTDEQMMQFRKALAQIEKTKANTPEYSKYMEYKNDKLYYHSQPTLDEQHKVTEAFESLMYEAFKQIGLSKNKVDKEIFKKYDLTDNAQLTELAERLVLLSQSSQNALSPVERLSEIISHFSGDVNSKTAKENFEAFTKGELTAAEVFNNLNRDGHTLNQETLDSLYKIDSANEMPVIESLLTQVVSALNAIESSVVNINNNTRQSTRDQFDTAINDILDIREGVNNKNILAGIKSIFDPLNISEYKNNEVLQIADGSILDAKDYIQDLFVKSHSEGSVSLDEMQIALDKFYLAMSNIQDAIKQVDLYEERTGKTHIDNAGEIAKYTLNDKYKEITDDNLLQQLLYLLSQAKVDISKSKEFYQGGFSGKQTDYDDGQVASVLQSVKSILDSIYGVLHGFTGIEADNKNALKYKEPVVDTGINRKEFSEQDLSVLNSILQVLHGIDGYLSTNKSDDVAEKVTQDNTDMSELVSFIRSKLSQQLATEDTLQSIKGAIEQIAELARSKDEAKKDDSADLTQNLNTLISALTANVTTLKDVANGIVQHQKAQKSDTSKAMARIQDPTEQQIISGIAKDSVIDLGTEVEIESLQALANGLVKVEGAFKNANGQWEGFAVKVNEANAAVDLAIKKQSAFARALNKAKDIDDNTYQYNKEEVEARAQKHLEEYAAQGKNATVQFKDSGRYTITILEEIDGLSKQIFQTFDENDDKIERTTVTMSNSQKMKLDSLQKKLIENGLSNGLISDKDNEYKNYQAAADALSNMTNAYSQMDNISDVEIANWKQQIALVQQLGGQVEALIKQRKVVNDQKVFESDRAKKLGKFNLDKANLESNIDMTKISDKLKSDIADAGKAIANATDADSLKIAINNWEALQNQIKATAVQQDLYIKNTSRSKSEQEKFDDKLKQQKISFAQYQKDMHTTVGVADELKVSLDELGNELESISNVDDLSVWEESLKSLKTKISRAQSSFKSSKLSEAKKIMGSANSEFDILGFKDNGDLTQEQQEIVDKKSKLKEQIEEYNKKINSSQNAEIDGIRRIKDELDELIDAYKKKHNIVSKNANNKKGQAYGTSQLQNFTARYNSLLSGASDVNLNEQSVVVANLVNAYKQLQTAQSAFVAGEDKTTAEYAKKIEVFKAAQLACNNYARELNSVVTASKKLENEGIGNPYWLAQGEFNLNDDTGRQSALRSYINTLGESVVAVGNFTDGCNKLHYTIKNGDGTFTAMTATINKARTAIVATAGDTENATGKFASFLNELKGKFKSISTYFMASFGIEEVWQQLRQGVQYVRDIDSALTELKKVTNETEASYDRFLQSMSKTGSVIGATVQDLTTMAADWAKLGYSMEEAGKLAESTAILLNVSEFQDANAASEALISTMQAFQYTADESQHVVDILNEIGNSYAVSSDGLATALQDSASALMTAGSSLEEAVALVAAANKVVQDPNSVGSALRTISLRLRGTSVSVLEQMGEETDGVIESTSKLQEKIKALSGVDILSANGGYRSPYEILKDIAEVYESIDPMDQAALIELIAGKNRANTLTAILTNFQDLEGAYNDALDAEGSAMRENERYLESVQGHIDTFNNSLQTMWMNFLNTDAVKWFIHLGDALIKLIDNAGVLQTILTSIGGIWLSKNFGNSLFGGLETTKNNIEQLKEAAKAAENIWVNDPTTKNKKAFDEAKENLEAYEAKLKEVDATTEAVGDTTQASGKKMSGAFSKVGKQLTQLAKSMAIMYAISSIFEVLGYGISLATEHFKENGNSVEALNDKYQEATDKLSDCESELRSLESELDAVNGQIETLEIQGSLTYAEQEELERLQSISSELERQISLKKTLQDSLQAGVNEKAINAANAYLGTSFDSDKSKTDRQEEAEESGQAIGQVAGNVIGAVAAPLLAKLGGQLAATASAGILSKLGGTVGTFFGGPAGTLVGMGIGAAAGKLIGGWIGSASEGVKYDQEQTVSEAIENMKEERGRLEKAANDAYEAHIASSDDKDKADAYNSAAQALSLYDEKMAEHIKTLSQYYNSVDWDTADDFEKEEARKIGDMIDKYSIEMNAAGAKVTALDRIFGENASEEIQAIGNQITEAVKNGQEFDFGKAVESSQELKDTLEYIGLDTEDVKDYFTQIGEEAQKAQEATSILSDLAKTLDSIQSKYDTLQGAIDEFNERGAISGETLKSLIDNNLLQYLTFTENGLIADANAMKALELATRNEAMTALNQAMVQDMQNYALGKTEQLSALAQNAISNAGIAAANSGELAKQGAVGFLTYADAVATAGLIDPGNLTAGLQQIYNAYQNIGNAIRNTSAYRPSDAYKSAAGIGGGKGGGGSSSNSAKEIDWIEHYYTEIENRIDELNARLENKISNVQALDAKNTIIDQIIDLYDQKQQKLANAVATYDARADYLFSTFSSDIQNKINNGSLDISSIKDESLASNIDEYYDYIEAASQARVEAEELKQTIADLAKQKFDNISTAYENEIGLVDAYIDALQDQIDATEARGEQVGSNYYEGMIDSAEKRKQSLAEERNALQASLDEAVKLGQVEVNSDTWYEMVNAIYEVDSAIVEAETSMEEWQTAINDLHWEHFDKLVDKLENISDELDNIYERLTDNDEAFDENGNWTNQGIAALGMLTQKMEQAQFAAQQYAEQIDKLNTDYAAGKYSEQEYNEKLAELTEAQWESIEAYEAAKDEIVDLNKARVDAVKDGMQKELDAYKELIDAKKESLEADKKAHEWANSIAEKEKNISDIQRKLAALASDNSTSANAQKKKLQAELLKAQAELEEAYYDKSIEDQQDALDKEYENYEENQQKEIDSLEEWLDDRETIIQDSFDLVKENAQVVYDELLNLSQEYGIQISDEIIAPWLAGKDAIGEYKDAFLNAELNEAASAFVSQLESVKDEWEEVASAAEDAADRQIAAVRRQQKETIAAYKEMQDSLSTITIGDMDNVGHDDSESGGSGGGAGWGGGGLAGAGGATEEVDSSKGNIFKTFGLKLRQAYENAANKLEASLDDFVVIADDATYQIFGESVPETYQRFLQNLDDSFGISTEGGVLVSDVFSGIFASESIPNEYKTFLDGIVSGLAECDDTEGRTATDFLSYVFASEDVPKEYKDFLTQIVANLDTHVTNGQITADLTSKQVAEQDIPEEFQKFLDGIVEGIENPVDYGTGIINGSSEASIGNIINTVDGLFANAAAATVNAANNNTPGMFATIGAHIDNLVSTINSWIQGVIDSVSGVFGGSSTHTSSSGRSHGGGGGGFADGTANANGTAYADGNWGAPKTETSLVGELGPEILVRNGKWTTVGENGAEFTQVKKGDIIFNHKQAEQLLKHGHVTGRGKAYASGTWKSASNKLDDLGEELTMCIGPNGSLQFLPNGATAMATDTIDSLTNLTQLDPTDILNRSRPSIGVHPSVVNNTTEIKIDASVGELIHVDHLEGNNLDEIGKFVDKAWEKKMQTLNNSIKKFTR